MDEDEIQFTVADEYDGQSVSPHHVPLKLLKSFASDVTEFLSEDETEVRRTGDLMVAVKEGSLAVAIARDQVPPSALKDLQRLADGKDIELVSPLRRKVITRWQGRARGNGLRSYSIIDGKCAKILRVTSQSNIRFVRSDASVWVERSIVGFVTEAGGSSKPNIHVRVGDKAITVSASPDLLASEERNILLKTVAMRVRVKHDLLTNELRDYTLIAFLDYESKFVDADVLRAIELGTQAWAGVGDSAEWVRQIRGSDE
ncbi:hypothetical protein [Xanthomonas arboricola]|uniref:hypothetical protein n=1 Tax=Xanthomonas arboricola TaxID=56448 RepID=UPI00118ACC65|nr:hypothetical protein [Xanthomonas arboricola]QDS15161.1 hypothetical protein FPL04_05555 [Xanthomonas arboricola]